jgi:ankyrin repeat protein
MLLGFRQVGTQRWDLLGAGETMDYALDSPLAFKERGEPATLELMLRDPHGVQCATATRELKAVKEASVGDAVLKTLQVFDNAISLGGVSVGSAISGVMDRGGSFTERAASSVGTLGDAVGKMASTASAVTGIGSHAPDFKLAKLAGGKARASPTAWLPRSESHLFSVGCTLHHAAPTTAAQSPTTAAQSPTTAAQSPTTAAQSPAAGGTPKKKTPLSPSAANKALLAARPPRRIRRSRGWLCASQSWLVFISGDLVLADEKKKRTRRKTKREAVGEDEGEDSSSPPPLTPSQSEEERVSNADAFPGPTVTWMALDAFPLPLEQVAAVLLGADGARGSGGEGGTRSSSLDARDVADGGLLIVTTSGERLRCTGLLDPARTCAQLNALLRGFMERAATERTLQLVRAKMAERVSTRVSTRAHLEDVQLQVLSWARRARGVSTANPNMDAAQAAVLVQSVTRRRRAARWHSQLEPTRIAMPELVDALASGDTSTFNLLLSRGASPDSVSHQTGQSSLHVACALQSADVIEKLIEARADVNLKTHDGWKQTPLHVAAPHGHTCIRLLLGAGADPLEARGGDGKRASQLSIEGSRARTELTMAETRQQAVGTQMIHSALIVTAAAAGQIQTVKALLHSHTHPDSFGPNGTTALHEACIRGHADLVRMLLEARAEPGVPSRPSEASAQHGASLAHSKHGAAPLSGIQRAVVGMTALHFAASAGCAPVLKLLLRAKADPRARDEQGQLPLYSCPPASSEARELLLRAATALSRAAGAEIEAEIEAEMHSVRLQLHAVGPVRELHVGTPQRAVVGTPQRLGIAADPRAQHGAPPAGGAAEPPPLETTTPETTTPETTPLELITVEMLHVHLRRVGLTLVDLEPSEILRFSLEHIDAHLMSVTPANGAPRQSVQLAVDLLQIDTPIESADFPVLLAEESKRTRDRRCLPAHAASLEAAAASLLEHPWRAVVGAGRQPPQPPPIRRSVNRRSVSRVYAPSSASDGPLPPMLFFSLTDQTDYSSSIKCIEEVRISLQPLTICLEQTLVARLVRMKRGLAEIADTAGGNQHERRMHEDETPQAEAPADEPPEGAESTELAVGQRAVVVAQRSKSRSKSGLNELYLKRVKIDQVRLSITVQIKADALDRRSQLDGGEAAALDDEDLDELDHLSAVASLASLDNWQIELPPFETLEFFSPPADLVQLAVAHYWLAALKALTNLLANKLGNVGKLFQAVEFGYSRFVARWEREGSSLLKLPAALAAGLHGFSITIADWILSFLSTNLGTSSTALARLTRDPNFVYSHLQAEQHKSRDFMSAMGSLEVLELGVRTGVFDLGASIRGASRGGVKGFVYGLSSTTVGGVLKISSGALLVASKYLEALNHKLTGGMHRRLTPRIRSRQSRDLSGEGTLLPYPPLRLSEGVLDETEGVLEQHAETVASVLGASVAKPALEKKPSLRVEAMALDTAPEKEKAAAAKTASEAQLERAKTVELVPAVLAPAEPSPSSLLKPWALPEGLADEEDVLIVRV